MKDYFPLHVHSHFSLLDGLSKPEHIAARIKELDLPGSALTDHGNISGAVQFIQKMEKAGKKPILGCELYICEDHATMQTPENRPCSHMVVLGKNDHGWKQLIKITSDANLPEHYYYSPRLSLEQLADYLDGSVIGISGHIGSTIAQALLSNGKAAPNWETDGIRLAKWLEDAFGTDNFYLEVQRLMADVSEEQRILSELVREVSNKTGIPCVATPDAHYAHQDQAEDQRILLCTNTKVTLQQAQDPSFGMSGFFATNNLHIPSYDEMISFGHTEEELENTLKIASEVGKYEKILRDPILPQFPCPDNLSADAYLRKLCDKGWESLVEGRVDDTDTYRSRVNQELEIFEGAGLSGYFLICQDIVNFVRRNGWLPGPGRGSAAGCLVSYLIGITSIDPMPYHLLFERFYNAGRNTGGRVSMPDIDMDVPVTRRDAVIDYIKRQYGDDKVSQMITYQTMKGRGALKDVLRAHGGVTFEEMNRMTKIMPEEAKIAGELKDMEKEFGYKSIIRWALEHTPDKLAEWCQLEDDGSLTGPMAGRFAQAIRLEGTKSAQSKHAAGVVIAPEALNQICPMVRDTKDKRMIAGMEMNDLESIGMIKFDLLGVAMLDKVMGVQQILAIGDVIA